MNNPLFYTPFAEWSKAFFYIFLALIILIGLWRKIFSHDKHWDNWIHFAVFTHFLVGAIYSGLRMLTTDEIANMLIRRIFAWEAWFNFACAAFYFLFLRYITIIREKRSS